MGLKNLFGATSSRTPAQVAGEINREVDIPEATDEEIITTIDQKSDEHDVDEYEVTHKLAELHPEVDEKILGRIREKVRSFIRDPQSFEDREEVRTMIDMLEQEGAASSDTANRAKEAAAAGNVDRAREIILEDKERIFEALGAEGLGDRDDVGLFGDFDTDDKVAQAHESVVRFVSDRIDLDSQDEQELREYLELYERGELTEEQLESAMIGDFDLPQNDAQQVVGTMLADDEVTQNTDQKMDQDTIENLADVLGVDVEDLMDIDRAKIMEALDDDENDDEDDVEQNAQDVDEKSDDDYVTEEQLDQKLEAFTDNVVEAVTDDEVIGQVAQKMVDDEDFQEDLVDTVDQKGDFTRTPNPANDGAPEGRTAADILNGNTEDN